MLKRIGNELYAPTDRMYLDSIIKLYPKYKDEAIENYLKILHKRRFV